VQDTRRFGARLGSRILRSLLVLGIVLCRAAHATAGSELPPTSSAPAYIRRGDEVEARYHSYRGRLEHFRTALGDQLDLEAPDLRAPLNAAPATPVPDGYQILPKVTTGPPAAEPRPRVASTMYGWGRTDKLIEVDLARLERLEAETRVARATAADERRRSWEQTVREYLRLAEGQKRIDGNIRYNRLWQADIHRRRDLYDRFTALHDAVVERQGILDLGGPPSPEAAARAQTLVRRIHDVTRRLTRPDFVRLEHPSPHLWVIRVPIATDIPDASFVGAFKAGVEELWRLRDGPDEFQVTLDIRPIAAAQLYAGGKAPEPGQHIDQAEHLARFPDTAAILTTGATLTHVNTRWSINLGPQDISLRVLSHELGHVLGFPDGYFRGYRDAGADGYEVLEIITDPDDIMSAPGFGHAQRHHFEALLQSFGVRIPGPALPSEPFRPNTR
jgi:hypothetical protein